MRDEIIIRKYENCIICPRRCGADRTKGPNGACHAGSEPVVNLAMLHHGEEPPISGTKGSGTVFFEGCPLGCVFCQNYDISRGITGAGKNYDEDALAALYLDLQEKGAHNINLVTAGHFIPSVAKSLRAAKENGLTIPVAYNSGGYETTESLKLLDGLIDIYMPDMKFFSSSLSTELCRAPDYFKICCDALNEMYRQTGPFVLDEDGIMQKGMIVRHLMLPGQLFDTKKVIDYLTKTFGNNIYISLMNQYTPFDYKYKDMKLPAFLQRKLPQGHYDTAADYLILQGQTNAFIQDDASGDELLPDFNS